MSSESSSVSTWLRWIGAALLVGATTTYLVQGWTDIGVLGRELSWAALTVSLAAYGIVAIRKLDDPKGARVGLALAAATIPVHFAEVGGGVWSYFHEGLGSLTKVLVAALVLVPIAPLLALGVSALVRRRSAALTGTLYLLSAALLVPTRHGDVIAAMVVAELLLVMLLEMFVWRRDVRLETPEGVTARCLLLVPVAILLLRNANYPATDLWISAVLFFPASIALVSSRFERLNRRVAIALETAGVFGVAGSLVMALWASAFSAVLVSAALALYAHRARSGAFFQWCGVGLFALCALIAFDTPDAALSLSIVPAAVVHAGVAYRRRSLGGLITACAAGVVGLVGQMSLHLRFPAENAWIVAAGAGVVFLVLASLIESRRADIQRVWARLGRHFAEEG